MHYLNLDPTWNPKFIKDSDNGLPAKIFNFPAGEAHVKLEPYPTNPGTLVQPYDVQVCHRFKQGDEMLLMLAANAVRARYWLAPLSVYLPYLPYARQDRQMVSGEPFSLQVLIELLATVGYQELHVLDPHNPEVTGALCAAYGMRLRETRFDLIYRVFDDLGAVREESQGGIDDSKVVLVSPDAGASKKIAKQAQEVNYCGPVFQGEKKRDLNTGHIDNYEVYGPLEQLQGKTAVIRDDICSKGGTFKLLAKALKEKGAKRVVLSVSHWEGTANLGELFDAGVEHVYTTNSLRDVTFSTASSDLIQTSLGRASTSCLLTQFSL